VTHDRVGGRADQAGTIETVHRDPMQEWQAVARRTLAGVALFSFFVNLLMLTLPLYLFQLSDRVLTSRNHDTLLMLTIVARLPCGACTARHPATASARATGDQF
jgi:ABC-type protease/lipase transport system fused ATPase/permease subunit